MHLFPSRARILALAVAGIALGACGDQANPTQATPGDANRLGVPNPPDTLIHANCILPQAIRGDAHVAISGDVHAAATCGGGNPPPPPPPPTISSVNLSTTIIAINGPPVSYTVGVRDPSGASGLSFRGSLIQGSTAQNAGGAPLSCGGGITICSGSSSFTAIGFVPGSAIFRVELFDQSGTVKASTNLAVTLVPAAQLTGLSLTSSSLYLDGPMGTDQITIQNVGPSISGVSVQEWINQGTVRRPANGTSVLCGSSGGVLPNGTCSFSYVVSASNSAGGNGILVPGAATLEVDLLQNGSVIGTKTVSVTLVPSATITSLNLSSSNLAINGTPTSYTVSFQNVATSLSGVIIQGWVNQGSVRHAAGGTVVDCGVGGGVLPNGTCTSTFSASANNGLSGPGTLVPGAATFELQLVDGNGVLLSSTRVPVTLMNP